MNRPGRLTFSVGDGVPPRRSPIACIGTYRRGTPMRATYLRRAPQPAGGRVGEMSERWARYYDAVDGAPRHTLLHALERFEASPAPAERRGVDLGCGTGRDTLELLRRGWSVLAVDSEQDGVERLLRGLDCHLRARLETLVERIEDARWPMVDLVNSSYALPFCESRSFDSVWGRIVASLRPGGRFCGQLFGDRDEWATRAGAPARKWESPPGMTFHSREEAETLLLGLDVELFDEVELDGETAVGDAKHGHLFHIVARKL
jgi:tellurite methyltransferase